MKFVAVVLSIAALAGSASAFAPATKARVTTQRSLVDADLTYQLADAVRATIMDCHDGHCKLVDAWKDPSGWHFEDRADDFRSESMGSSSRVLMLEFDETE